MARITDQAGAPVLGKALATAYRSNPLVQWMFEDDLSDTRLQGLFTSLVGLGMKNGLVYSFAPHEGGAIWFPPVLPERVAPDVTCATAAWTAGRRDAALAVLAAHRPTERHFSLDAVGIVPERRRRGEASALLAPALAMCDADGVGAYLENSDAANAPFYRRQGFVETGALPMPEGAPPVVSMWRLAR